MGKAHEDTGRFVDIKQDGAPVKTCEGKVIFKRARGLLFLNCFYMAFIIDSMKVISSSDRPYFA